jgi:hypothetical protein
MTAPDQLPAVVHPTALATRPTPPGSGACSPNCERARSEAIVDFLAKKGFFPSRSAAVTSTGFDLV